MKMTQNPSFFVSSVSQLVPAVIAIIRPMASQFALYGTEQFETFHLEIIIILFCFYQNEYKFL